MMNRMKKQIFIIAGFIVLLLGVLIFLYLRDKDDTYSTDYNESGRENVVEYDGKKYQYNEHLSNYLFMGIDTREQEEDNQVRGENGRADAIYLLSYDRVKKTAKAFAIPRDTMASVHAYSMDGTDLGFVEDHINMQYVYGDGKEESCRLMKEAISDMMYGIPIQGYLALNMDGIPVAVEALESVEVVVPNASLENMDSKYKEGSKVAITKENAELFVRYRDTNIAQSAITRMERQKAFMEAFMETARTKASNDTELVLNMYDGLKPYMITNMGTDLFAKLLDVNYESDDKIQDIPGEKVDGNAFDEYHINEEQLYELVLQHFYKEVQGD